MPASLPGSTNAANRTGNPNAGPFVIFDPLSGPKGSPKDKDQTGNASTGALCTGIGYGGRPRIGLTAPASIKAAGFTDDYQPGTKNSVTINTVNSTWMYVGGGRSINTGSPSYRPIAGQAGCSPYTAGIAICGAGEGGSRDGGAGPAFTGFPLKMVTAAGAVATGAVIETGFVNRSGFALTTGQSVFGSASAALAAPS